ncbi:transaldolase [Jatrophihabitans telluris]|uniref:Transaldolase n=1 Tax=Jatrophihabitans telluris TaxID=2038343 RepID=A0ABY4R4F9_9ACTN|nr:transaldolase [Jatrophihabitans telluris]UQX90178.1 transaldolase [Jatrophihabitans telluris]
MSESTKALSAQGVSIWLDDISRERLVSGNLRELIDSSDVVGVTSNPSIFQKALEQGAAYDEQTKDLVVRGVQLEEAVRLLTSYDIRWACDVLKPVYESSQGKDGRVSIEVDPRIAHETDKTTAEAKALWWLVDRPNVMIKIPATLAGLPAITAATAAGISVNVTLIFSIERYLKVMEAYLAGLEQARTNGVDLSTVRSVASFFVSRVDTEIDKRLDKLGTDEAKAVRGKAGIANARLAYEAFDQVFAGERWQSLAADGANKQRPLWASTGVKDPNYDDTMYVTQLVAPDTVNTMPEATLNALVDHGTITGQTANTGYDEARAVFADLSALGIEIDEVTELLETEGVQKFMDSWSILLEGVKGQLDAVK